jgi:hypothetical protein
MNSLSHDQAREFVQQDHLMEEDRLALRQHLATCEECRVYAAMHLNMMQQLPLRAPRAAPTAAQRAAILDAANGRPAPRLWRPLAALGSVAAVLFLAMAFWLVMRAASPFAAQPPAPLATSLAPFLPPSAPAATPDPRGRYVIDTVPAPSLAGNTIGEPLEQRVVVYLPPSYDATNRRYPVVYGLFYASHADDRIFDEFGRLARSGMNIALNNEAAQEMILVVPDGINALNMSNHFVNSPVTGDWESFLARDLVAHIDANYRTLPEAGSRGLLGQSHLAPAALATAERFPDVFSAVYLSEPWVVSPAGIEQSPFFSAISRENVVALLEELATLTPEQARARMAGAEGDDSPFQGVPWWTVGFGIAYAPTDDAAPPYFKYPYNDSDGPADPAVWQVWEDSLGQVPERIQANLEALRTLDIAISHPTGITEPALLTADGPTYLSEQLTAAGISHRYLEQDKAIVVEVGEDALPFFAEAFANE